MSYRYNNNLQKLFIINRNSVTTAFPYLQINKSIIER